MFTFINTKGKANSKGDIKAIQTVIVVEREVMLSAATMLEFLIAWLE